MIIPVTDLGKFGLAPDVPYSELALNAWTDARNVRFREGGVEKFSGQAEVYSGVLYPPYFLKKVSSIWVYAGLAKVGATDGSSHANITRTVGGDYSATAIAGWTGAEIEGILVLNNGVDDPQYWSPSLANDLAVLTAWPANTKCAAMRELKGYLVALDVTKTTTRYKDMVKWSHKAAANALPSSWDETDETVDAGEWTLPDGGECLDLIPLGDVGIIYKNFHTWRMSYVGGIRVFDFQRLFTSFGAVNKRCAIPFLKGQHVVFTGDDLVVHDTVNVRSVLDGKAKTLLRNTIQSDRYNQAFVQVNYRAREVWLGYVERGYTLPNKALVWNWLHDTITLREIPGVPYIESDLVTANSDLWSSSSSSWESDTGIWSDDATDLTQRHMLMCDPTNTKLLLADSSNTFNGTAITAYVERRNLGFPLKNGAPPDFTTEKLLRGIWPRIEGTSGGVVTVYVGSQDKVNGTITWDSGSSYTIGTSDFLDVLVAGRMFALKFQSTTNISWKLSGYDVDVKPIGSRAVSR